MTDSDKVLSELRDCYKTVPFHIVFETCIGVHDLQRIERQLYIKSEKMLGRLWEETEKKVAL